MRTTVAVLLFIACTPQPRPSADAKEADAAPPLETRAIAKTPAPAREPEPTPARPSGPRFHVVATSAPAPDGEGTPRFHVWETADHQLFVSAGPQVMRVGENDAIARDTQWLAGLETFRSPGPDPLYGFHTWEVIAAGGRADAFYITLTAESGFRGEAYPHAAYRRAGDQWVALKSKGSHFFSFPRDLAGWVDGSVLALRGFTADHEYDDRRSEEWEPSKAMLARAATAIAREKKLIVIHGAPKAPDLGREDFGGFDALDSGEIVGVVEGEKPIAVHYDHGSGKLTERALPESASGLAFADVQLESSARAWIFGRVGEAQPYLARFDGEAWVDEPLPSCGEGIVSHSRAPDGDAWVVCAAEELPDLSSSTVWHRPEGGDWEAVTLPEDTKPASVLARAADDVWIAGDTLLHTKASTKTIAMPTYTGLANEIFEYRDAAAPFGCNPGTVLLRAEVEGDHADLVAALGAALPSGVPVGDDHFANVALVEVTFRGEPRIALQYNTDVPKTVRGIVEKALGDRVLETYCVSKEPTRELGSW